MKLELKTRQRLALALVLLVAAMIFYLSSQDSRESSRLSNGVTEVIVPVFVPSYRTMPPTLQRITLRSWQRIIRKLAHFSEYALLGLTLVNYLRLKLRDGRLPAAAALAWGIASLYAATDEYHQSFVSGRGPALADVAIDSGGALAGALIAMGLFALLRRRRRARRGSDPGAAP